MAVVNKLKEFNNWETNEETKYRNYYTKISDKTHGIIFNIIIRTRKEKRRILTNLLRVGTGNTGTRRRAIEGKVSAVWCFFETE